MTRPTPDPAIQRLREEVAELRDTSSDLSAQVSSLDVTLKTLSDLRDAQEQTAAKVDDVAEHSVTKQQAQETARRLALEKRRSLIRVWLTLAALVVVIAGSGVLIQQNRDRAHDQARNLRTGCERTQARLAEDIRFLTGLADQAGPYPLLQREVRAHVEQIKTSLVDCTIAYPTD